jgi:hypothetical protein
MGISNRIKRSQLLRQDTLERQRDIVDKAWAEQRTLNPDEQDEFDACTSVVKALDGELPMLAQQLAEEAATARPPNSDPDWR